MQFCEPAEKNIFLKIIQIDCARVCRRVRIMWYCDCRRPRTFALRLRRRIYFAIIDNQIRTSPVVQRRRRCGVCIIFFFLFSLYFHNLICAMTFSFFFAKFHLCDCAAAFEKSRNDTRILGISLFFSRIAHLHYINEKKNASFIIYCVTIYIYMYTNKKACEKKLLNSMVNYIFKNDFIYSKK